MTTAEGIAMILVENLDPALRQRHGPQMHLTGEYGEAVRKARLGEKRGKWRILSGIDGMKYTGKEMVAGGDASYLTKDSFTALNREDVLGPKE